MPRFPGYGPPFQYYRPYNYRPRTPISNPVTSPKDVIPPQHSEPPLSQKHDKSSTPVWLDLFGIKLYFDDVLILSLLFFLYKEDVKDEGLFLALVMLLIS